MKVTAMEQAESVSDILCDVCGDSTRVEGYGLQFGTLRASWGFGSAHDGERYEVHLCELCFYRTLAGLKRERMVNTMFMFLHVFYINIVHVFETTEVRNRKIQTLIRFILSK